MYSHFNNEPVAKRVNNLFTDRLRQFTSDGEYRSLNLPAFYERERLDGKNHVAIETYAVSDLRRPLFKDALKEADGHWKPAKKGSEYGPSWATHWFKIQVCVPPEWKKNYYKKGDLVVFNWNLNCEGLVFSESGEALIGLSGEERREWPIPDNWFDGKCHTFYIEASCNGMFGNATGSSIQPPATTDISDWTLQTSLSSTPRPDISLWIFGLSEMRPGSSQGIRGNVERH